MSEQVFSSDNDVLPETGPIGPTEVAARGCLALLIYKIGCLLIFLAIIVFAIVLARMID